MCCYQEGVESLLRLGSFGSLLRWCGLIGGNRLFWFGGLLRLVRPFGSRTALWPLRLLLAGFGIARGAFRTAPALFSPGVFPPAFGGRNDGWRRQRRRALD